MSSSERADRADATDAAREFFEAEVDAALDPYRADLPAEDVAWIRERLIEGGLDEGTLAELVRAALPRHVDESGEVFYGRGRRGR